MKNKSKVDAAISRAQKLSPEERTLIAKKAAASRWDKEKDVPQAAYTGELKIGDMVFPCSVLSNGDRVLTQSDFMTGMGMYYSGWVAKNRSEDDIAADVPHFLSFKSLKPFVDRHLGDLQSIAVKYRTERGNLAHGVKADIIPKICDVWLDAENEGTLGVRQKQIAAKAKLVMRALAHVGIIALVDEATGYQKDRASDALSKILEAFIAKELQPWVKTFPDEYYEQLFRLRDLTFPTDSVKRPQYFGHLTNDIVYKRLAPSVLDELKKTTPKTPKGRAKEHFHRRLTPDLGHPKLREHMASVITAMKLSRDYNDFRVKLDMLHPRYDETMAMDFMLSDDDHGKGL
ncbi:P63C domain-containing protein [Shinella sumterensis]|uniref:P63C domain-containing protein n=1 Tax=Shinella sumterensis TaxID=1967501 RepID=A0AA50CMD6_9HYPH|nr:P63C domain-containing protein [Shinella sumterensis]WLR98648.1 P63C domain-containing protein [Shinella sumterensis]